ncbi:MAG: GNAT family N-acetyltransferase [Thermoplasmata archaeon]
MSARNPTDPADLRPRTSATVRRAGLADLDAMARVHVNGWKTTYPGMVPDEILDRLTVESDLASGFGSGLKEPRPGAAQFVALTRTGEIVGYALACPNRDPDPDFTGELEAIYVLKSRQGRGVGTALVQEVTRHLVNTGTTSMIVWVLEANPYRRFYEHLGGTLARRRMGKPHRLGGGPLPEVGYGWNDIRKLTGL